MVWFGGRRRRQTVQHAECPGEGERQSTGKSSGRYVMKSRRDGLRMHKTYRTLIALVAAFSLSTAVSAASNATPDQFDSIRAQQTKMRSEIVAGTGRYAGLSQRTRDQLARRQNRVLRAIDGRQSPAELSEPERLALFNDLEWIEATVNSAEDERMVCERVTTTGSTMKRRVCKTARQVRQEREQARQEMERRAVEEARTN